MPQTENFQQHQIMGFTADAATTKKLGATLAAGEEVANSTTAGERIIGVINDTTTAAGDSVGVVFGPCRKLVTSGAAFDDAAALTQDTDGKFVAATANTVVNAYALAAATAADESVPVLLLPPSQYRYPGANIADLTAITGGESPTEAEHNLVVTKVNAILTALEAQGILASS